MAKVCHRLLLLAGASAELDAQQWLWPEEPENLQELAADFPAERLSAVMRGFTSALGVRCSMPHGRGRRVPQALGERRRADGGETAPTCFRQLRERYYGAGAYDFTGRNVASVADAFLQEGDTASATRMLEWNVEGYPDSATAHEALGDLLLATDARAGARAAQERALELQPESARIVRKLAPVG